MEILRDDSYRVEGNREAGRWRENNDEENRGSGTADDAGGEGGHVFGQ